MTITRGEALYTICLLVGSPVDRRLLADFLKASGYEVNAAWQLPDPNDGVAPSLILADEQASGTGAYEPVKHGRPDLGTATEGSYFSVDEHRTSYTYDPLTGTYGKVEDGETMTDASLNKPDQLFMVLVMHAREFLVSDIESGCCTHGRDFDLDSGGPLDIYFRGQHATGTWSAANSSSPLVFANASGQVLDLPNGLVWVDVVGN